MTAEGAGSLPRLLEEPDHRRDARAARGLAEECGVAERRDAMFAGEQINVSEDRSVLHVALRMPRERSLVVDGADVVAEVHEVLDRMARVQRARAQRRSGRATPASPIRNVINIGIGGSDLGPGDGVRGAAPLLPARDDVPVRLERRRHRLRRGDARPRPRRDPVHHLVEDVHDARDDDQRADRARLGRSPASGATRRPSRSHFVAVSTNADEVAEVRDRHRRTCSASGTGSAAATRWTRRSGSRRCSRSGRRASRELLGRASTRWTSTSARRRSSATCPC